LSPVAVGIVGTAVALVLLFLGMPIALALMVVGCLGLGYLSSFGAALPVTARTVYSVVSDYSYTVIPLFVLMGGFATVGGLVGELYDTGDKWLRGLPGGLAIATVGACAGFAAVCGSSVAEAAAMGSIALPEMKRFNYSPRLATGSIAAGGTLGFLIPPSIGFVVYGMLTQQSVGKLLIAGIFPGLILALAYTAVIIAQVKFNPNLAPASPEPVSWKQRLLALKGLWEILVVFFVVLGGIYLGWFTPTEAGASGAGLLFFITLAKRKLTRDNLFKALEEAIRVSVLVLFLVAGATVFSYFLALSTIPAQVANWVAGLGISRYWVVVFVVILYLILGCFIDAISMMVLTMPILFPMMLELGFEPIWFGVICVLMMEAGLITPPMGLNVYTLAGVAKDVPVEEIFRGALPFLISILVVVILMTVSPEIALFLPGKMLGG
jgi:tripartite ATP-independent transporter DctM subunit